MEGVTAASAPQGTTLRERRQARTRQELVDAVLAVVAEGGVDAATIDRVSAQSGISRGTVYAHFPGGRDELLRAAYARLGTELVERTRAAASAEGEWRERLAAHAREMNALAATPHIGDFFNVSGPTLIVDGAERGIGSGASVAMIREDLAAARERGEVAAEVDPESTAVLLVGALREGAIRVAGGVDEGRITAAFARLVAGLARASASAG